MSADSESHVPPKLTAQQMWQNYGSDNAVAHIDETARAENSNEVTAQSANRTAAKNNNYVNFNQFIMQHNLLGGGVSGENSGVGKLVAVPPSSSLINYSATSNHDSSFRSMDNGISNSAHTACELTSGCLDNYKTTGIYNNSNNLDLKCNNAAGSCLHTNGYTAIASEPLYGYALDNDNVFAPFGSGGTTYYTNPFSAGFDFSSSNLQATAPEFVPRFGNLTLSDGDVGGRSLASLSSPTSAKFTVVGQTNGSDHVAAVAVENGGGSSDDTGSHWMVGSTGGWPAPVVPRSTGATSKTTMPYSATLHATAPIALASCAHGNSASGNGVKMQSGFPSAVRVERDRDRDRDHRRYQHGRRTVDYNRSNKRRDDWNRNRDRVNGFRVEEKYSTDNAKDSPLPSPEKKLSPKKIYLENEKLSQREKLIRDIETRRLECLVCVEQIKAQHSVWSCQNCYHILHLQCIVKWASSSKSTDGWRCPACQNVVKEVPRDYYCFCGKVKSPPFNRQDTAHTCGELCGRIEGCAHACTLLCHPGPCPPCQANVHRECGCGKTTKTMQCCLKEAIECDAVCGKTLNCEVHTCAGKCHAGKCEPCGEKVNQSCHCSKQVRQVTCTRDSHDKLNYSCGKPCGKDLECSNHKCKDCCHAGPCRPCKLSPEMVAACPCGKMPLQKGHRNSCLDQIPLCDSICCKTLRCGKAAHPHHCISKCHLGNCPPCNKQTAVKCRCGHMDQMIKCRQLSTRADDARCKKRCVKKRSCGKHKCNQECCIDIDHICPLPCNYTLSCGKHKCDQPCHRGNCPPCYRSSFEELYCECRAEVIYPPVACGTKRPLCKRPCSRAHPCSHQPQHNCHSSASCPPCMMFTTKWCYGRHEQRKTIPCSQESFSCGLACNKQLPCDRHKCIKSCHEGPCQAASSTEICKQSCTTLRATCGHKCMAPCHANNCPETPCKELVEVQCDCGNRKQMRACHDLSREFSRIATAQLASSMAEMQRGNYMELSEILAPIKANKTNKTLDCNEECRLLERNRRLAVGLQIRNPDLPQKLLTKYTDFIRTYAKRDAALVKSIYDALSTLVKLAKESKQKSRSHSFPTMNREKRQLVHEMCEMFGVDSVAYDAEPNRNVVATAYRDRSWLPATSIMEVMQRESGQRRVPVPSNNAWGVRR